MKRWSAFIITAIYLLTESYPQIVNDNYFVLPNIVLALEWIPGCLYLVSNVNKRCFITEYYSGINISRVKMKSYIALVAFGHSIYLVFSIICYTKGWQTRDAFAFGGLILVWLTINIIKRMKLDK